MNKPRLWGLKFCFDPVDQLETTSDAFAVHTPNGIRTGNAVIAAPGAQRRKLDCPGEGKLVGAVFPIAPRVTVHFSAEKPLPLPAAETRPWKTLFSSLIFAVRFI